MQVNMEQPSPINTGKRRFPLRVPLAFLCERTRTIREATSQVAGAILYNGINVWLARGCAVPRCRDGPVQKGAIMLVTTKEMLLDAKKNHYGVGAFNVENL